MEFFQEPTLAALLALVLSFIVVKIVSFAVSNSSVDCNIGVNGGAVVKEVIMDRGMRVRGLKGQKRVKFVDDVVIRRIDRYEGSENSGERKSEEQYLDERERDDAKGSEEVEMQIEEESDGNNMDRVVSEKEEEKSEVELGGDTITDETGGIGGTGSGESEGLFAGDKEEEEKSEVELGGDTLTDEKGGIGGTGTGESGGLFNKEEEEGKKREDEDEDEDDDWEGIERSELEKVFAEAVNYVEYGGKGKEGEDGHLAKLSSDVQLELYGLHKVAVEGPCTEPPPMALRVSARAKWNAWQRMRNVSRKTAMEQYIRVLSDSIPDWMNVYSADDIRRELETVGDISVEEQGRKVGPSATSIGDSTTDEISVEKMVTLNQYIMPYASAFRG